MATLLGTLAASACVNIDGVILQLPEWVNYVTVNKTGTVDGWEHLPMSDCDGRWCNSLGKQCALAMIADFNESLTTTVIEVYG